MVNIFEKLNDRQFKIHTHMRTGDLLALKLCAETVECKTSCK